MTKVYFISVDDCADTEAVGKKLDRLLEASRLFDFIKPSDKVAVKTHFGEEGNAGFVKPKYVRLVCERVAKTCADCALADTNTLYRGRRLNAKGHLMLAYEHGFTRQAAGAGVVIAEGSRDVAVNQKFIKTAKVAPLFSKSDVIIGIAHFKGHIMCGFGGALKNIGMGCASREGKLAQHSDVTPFVRVNNCDGCAECRKACPVSAITIVNKKSVIDDKKCIGCATCIAVCPHSAMDVAWERGAGNIQEKMAEYAKAVLTGKEKKSAFINFAIKITKECDCLAKDDPKIAPDTGIFASVDPVAIDKACVDLVNAACGRDIFREAWPDRDWARQLSHASQIGLGSLDYELIRL